MEGHKAVPPKTSEEEEPQGIEEDEDLEDDLEDLDDEDAVAEGLAMAGGDDEEGDEEASLEELLAQRAAGRRAAGDDSESDEDDIMALASEKEPTGAETIRTKVIPIKDQQEFVCKRCFLVKARSQLADETRMLCRDCV
ncbi:MAG: hypothetical protein QOG54_626 [Actinomycetota bacterium]|jgi:hypothetical protein|nr:hypothetical protein [Actinomycetota bacterium]